MKNEEHRNESTRVYVYFSRDTVIELLFKNLSRQAQKKHSLKILGMSEKIDVVREYFDAIGEIQHDTTIQLHCFVN